MQIIKKITKIKQDIKFRTRLLKPKIEMLKFVPFLMNIFDNFVKELNFDAEKSKCNFIEKPQNERYYAMFDLIIIFNNPQLKSLRLLWKLFLRKRISQIILNKIQSQKVQNMYLQKVNRYIFSPYFNDAYHEQILTQIEAEGNKKYYKYYSSLIKCQIMSEEYSPNQQMFLQKIKQLLTSYINEDQSDTIQFFCSSNKFRIQY